MRLCSLSFATTENVRNDVPMPVRLFSICEAWGRVRNQFSGFTHTLDASAVYAREGVRDLNFRRSNVWTTEEEKEGHEEDEETGKRDTRGLHLAEFHARAGNVERKWNRKSSYTWSVSTFSPLSLSRPHLINLELVLFRLILVTPDGFNWCINEMCDIRHNNLKVTQHILLSWARLLLNR